MKSLAVALTACIMILFSACGGDRPDEPVDEPGSEDIRTVRIVDSIGVELGDSNYVLGAIESLCFGPRGNIHALDLVRGSVMIYTSEGTYVKRVARKGEGPGEITFPLDMTVLNDGRIMITALGGIHEYTPEGDYLGVAAEYYANPPMNLTAVGDSSLLASKLTVEPDEDGNAVVDYWLSILDDDGGPGVVFATDRMPFDPQDLTETLNRTWMAYSIAADPEGRIYLAPNSSEEFIINVYDRNAELLRTIGLEVPMVQKAPEEIREEKEWMELHLQNMGVSGVLVEFEPDPYRRMITDLGVDAEGRIWARKGTELRPVFEVFSLEGEHLFTAEIPGVGDAGQFWNFAIEDRGMAAYSTNPELYQQIYLLRLE